MTNEFAGDEIRCLKSLKSQIWNLSGPWDIMMKWCDMSISCDAEYISDAYDLADPGSMIAVWWYNFFPPSKILITVLQLIELLVKDRSILQHKVQLTLTSSNISEAHVSGVISIQYWPSLPRSFLSKSQASAYRFCFSIMLTAIVAMVVKTEAAEKRSRKSLEGKLSALCLLASIADSAGANAISAEAKSSPFSAWWAHAISFTFAQQE